VHAKSLKDISFCSSYLDIIVPALSKHLAVIQVSLSITGNEQVFNRFELLFGQISVLLSFNGEKLIL
jgi:hypothetical protein